MTKYLRELIYVDEKQTKELTDVIDAQSIYWAVDDTKNYLHSIGVTSEEVLMLKLIRE
jgi:hypothetical protein